MQTFSHLVINGHCATFTPQMEKVGKGGVEGAPNWVFFFTWDAVLFQSAKILQVSCLLYMIAKIHMVSIYNTCTSIIYTGMYI